jgi:cobalt-precorrin-5B (C1)-methyltransferase
MSGRTGFTTGTCAAAAAKAATMILSGLEVRDGIDITLPGREIVRLTPEYAYKEGAFGIAAIKKDAGDDPDVTDGCLVCARVSWNNGTGVEIAAGEGVGTVTKPGLSVPPGGPAINPIPRQMIIEAVRSVTKEPLSVVISIPGGEKLAEKTFNPRLGVLGGLSILGTSGIVRPFSSEALRDALKCSLDVALACRVKDPVLVPGRIGARAAQKMFALAPEQLIEISNEWGFMLDLAAQAPFDSILAAGHPGKLAKLPAGWWDTHSSRSGSAVPYVSDIYKAIIGKSAPESLTVEAIFKSIPVDEIPALGNRLAAEIANAVRDRIRSQFTVSVILVDLQGNKIGSSGDLSVWPPAR